MSTKDFINSKLEKSADSSCFVKKITKCRKLVEIGSKTVCRKILAKKNRAGLVNNFLSNTRVPMKTNHPKIKWVNPLKLNFCQEIKCSLQEYFRFLNCIMLTFWGNISVPYLLSNLKVKKHGEIVFEAFKIICAVK